MRKLQIGVQMLKVKSYLDASKVHGIGLFAGENIKEGSIVWQLNPFIDQIFTMRKFRTISKSLNHFGQQHLYASSYKRNNKYYYITDNARFINHSENDYNIIFVDDHIEKAYRDIKKGEEILENYFLCYDKDDWFYFEINNLKVSKYLKLNGRERKSYVESRHILG